MHSEVAQELERLRIVACAPLAFHGLTFEVDKRFSFEPMAPQALSIFFHWPSNVADAVTRSALGGILATLAPHSAVGGGRPSVSRGLLLYTDAAAAETASSVLAPWLIDSLLADPTVPTLVRETTVPPIGETVVWALSGTMSGSNGNTLKRADIGWRRGPILAFAVCFGEAEVVDMCAAAAGQMDSGIEPA